MRFYSNNSLNQKEKTKSVTTKQHTSINTPEKCSFLKKEIFTLLKYKNHLFEKSYDFFFYQFFQYTIGCNNLKTGT